MAKNNEKEDLKNYVLVRIDEYEKLIECRTKAEQYKQFILKQNSNNNLTRAMTVIERKDLYELITEKNNEKEK